MFLTRLSRWFDIAIPTYVKLKTGGNMKVVLPDNLSTEVAFEGDYEPEVTECIEKYVRKKSVFFDIGAHFGLRSLQAMGASGGDIKIVAFEPGPFQLKILRENCSKYKNIVVIDCAVSNVSGRKLKMQIFGIRFIGSSTVETPRIPQKLLNRAYSKKEVISVKTISIDDYVENSGIIPDVIKIDVENHEYHVLIGAINTLKKYHPIIIMETGDLGRKKGKTTWDCLRVLGASGYKLKKLGDSENVLAY